MSVKVGDVVVDIKTHQRYRVSKFHHDATLSMITLRAIGSEELRVVIYTMLEKEFFYSPKEYTPKPSTVWNNNT